MKNWMGTLLFTVLGLGLGFFAGEQVGRRKAQKEAPAPQPDIPEATEEETVQQIAEENGYISSDEKATDEYLGRYEHPEEEEESDGGGDEIEEILRSSDPDHYIFLTDQDEWDQNPNGIDQVEWFYYEEDEVVCDEDEKRVDDPEDQLGERALNTFGMNPLNPQDVIFVRNEFTETLYKITRIHNAYGRVVLGLDALPDVERDYPV